MYKNISFISATKPIKIIFYPNIYKDKKNRSKHDLIDMAITERDQTKLYKPDGDNLIQEEANLLLKNSNFAKHSTKKITILLFHQK